MALLHRFFPLNRWQANRTDSMAGNLSSNNAPVLVIVQEIKEHRATTTPFEVIGVSKRNCFKTHKKRKTLQILCEINFHVLSETIQKQNDSSGETEQHWSLQQPELSANTKVEMK
jgi:hypothetical protein